jgi:hypothetical protein
MRFYHVVTAKSSAEIEVIKDLKPPRLLLSYFYFRNKPLEQFINDIGYIPEIYLDSGAWSAYTKNKGIALTDYLKYIQENEKWITAYFSLDVVFDSLISYRYWQIMGEKGFNPIPIFHYQEDVKLLQMYAEQTDFIGLGGTVTEPDKNKVADWARMIIWQYPELQFHLLGSSSKKIIDTCDLVSADSSSWFMMAVNGYPKHIKRRTREAKINRAKYNLEQELQSFRIRESPSFLYRCS